MLQAIEARGLAKRFGAVTAVEVVDLTLAPGEALGLLGPNGAGKSTLLSLVTGLRPADRGEIRIFGHPAGSEAARKSMGLTPQSAAFPPQITPRELIAYASARHGKRPDTDRLVTAFGLERLIDRRMAGFSGGEVRRVALALAFCGAPRLAVVDEPTTGLDAATQEAFQSLARDYVASGGAMLLTSHHWDEIEAICDRLTMIDRGQRVLDGTLAEMRATMRINRISLVVDGAAPDWLPAPDTDGRRHLESADSDAVVTRLVREGVGFRDLLIHPLALKDILAHLRHEV